MLYTSLPNYAPLADFLTEAGAYLDASELHGMLCGFICAGLSVPNPAWMTLLLASAHEDRRLELEACVQNLFTLAFQQLSSFSFDFEILLPTEADDHERVLMSSLSRWTEHYMLGLSIAEALTREGKKALTPEQLKSVKEAKNDIQSVSRVYNQSIQCDEIFDEEAFTTLLEHVRIAVMLIFTELNGRIRPTQH